MNDITDALIQVLSDLIDEGFELPIYMFCVSRNGSLVAARYEGNPLLGETKARIFAEHIESAGWDLPVNCFFVDSRGILESVRIGLEGFTATSEPA